MRGFAVGAIAASILFSPMSLQAADLPVKARPLPIPAFSWNGFYVGGHVGGAWGDSRYDAATGPVFPAFAFAPPPFIIVVPARIATLPGVNANDTGFLGGGQIGFNRQFGRFVLGAEADASGTQLRESVRFNPVDPFAFGQVITGTYSTQIDWMASVRGRIGFAFDRVLFYGTGGVAFTEARINTTFTLTQPPNTLLPAGGTTNASTKFNNTGWTVGGGIEWAFSDAWSVAGEYRHSDFGRKAITLASTDPAGFLAPLTTNVKLAVDQATVRLNYRFGAR